jgi:type II secretory pathway component PulC
MKNQTSYIPDETASILFVPDMLAHHINFYDNKLMINKIKDFLKNKFGRKKVEDLSDQSESDDEISDQHLTSQIETGDEESWDASSVGAYNKLESSPQSDSELLSSDETTSEAGDEIVEEDLEIEASEEYQVNSNLPEKTAAYKDFSPSQIQEEFTERKLSFKEKITAFLARSKFKLSQVKFKRPDLSGIKLPQITKMGPDGPALSPNLSRSLEKFLSRESREVIHQFTIVLMVCGVTYILGKLSALALRGDPTLETAKSFSVEIPMDQDFQPMVLNQVKSINIFRTNSGIGNTKKLADTKCEEATQASSLPIKLVNTIVLQDTIKSLASVQVRGDRVLQEVREGDSIDNLAKIFKITRLEILVKNLENGTCESIASEDAEETTSPISVMSPSESRAFKATKKMSGIENVGNKFLISKVLLDEKMKDIGSILTQAKAIKIQNPDGTLAFKMTELDPNGIFTYLGIQDQDIITSIDGKPIYDMNEVMTKFAKIKNLDKLQLGIKREGSDSFQDYSIKK